MPLKGLTCTRAEFFNVLDEFFRRATGGSAEDFAALDEFPAFV